jgi:exonuclease VII large subunit
LRTAIVEDADGVTWFTVDQPSTRFSSFDTPQISAVGIELDRKLAELLAVLDAPVPTALTES